MSELVARGGAADIDADLSDTWSGIEAAVRAAAGLARKELEVDHFSVDGVAAMLTVHRNDGASHITRLGTPGPGTRRIDFVYSCSPDPGASDAGQLQLQDKEERNGANSGGKCVDRLGRELAPHRSTGSTGARSDIPAESTHLSLTDKTLVPYLSCICYVGPVDFMHPIEAVIPGVQGRVLAVLVETTAELNLRTLARLAGVSVAQASRVMPNLVELGLVERREVPPSSLFRLNGAHVAAKPIMALARSRDDALHQLGAATAQMKIQPASVIVFGSFARGEADAHSDIDAVVVRPDAVAESDDDWADAVELWRQEARTITGNRTEVIEAGCAEIARKLAGNASLWRDVARHGVVVHGLSLKQLKEALHA